MTPTAVVGLAPAACREPVGRKGGGGKDDGRLLTTVVQCRKKGSHIGLCGGWLRPVAMILDPVSRSSWRVMGRSNQVTDGPQPWLDSPGRHENGKPKTKLGMHRELDSSPNGRSCQMFARFTSGRDGVLRLLSLSE